MSALRPSPTTPGTFLCPRCGNTLRDDQAWCLECGLAARTRVHPPRHWRTPIAVTFAVLALLAAGIALALVTLLDKPESVPAPATVTVTTTTAAPPAATTPTAPSPAVTTPPATVPTTTVPSPATAPTTPAPTATTPAPAPSGGGRGTFTIPGTRIRLPANAD